MSFPPTSVKEMRLLGWEEVDVVLFTGDAYVDHPSFGAAVIARTLEAEGYRVAVVPQPNWRDDLRDFRKFGAPKLFFGVTGGNMDSMVNHYTAAKRLRSDDAYTPGDKAGQRPDYAATVYSQILKRLYPNTPVVLGGIEASLRRLTHYDYWSDKLKPSILTDSGADLLCYGMSEETIVDVARALSNGFNANLLRKIPQTAFVADRSYIEKITAPKILLNSFEKCVADKRAFADNFVAAETESNRMEPLNVLIEPVGERFVVINPAAPMPDMAAADRPFDLPYTRLPHPRYNGKGDIPAYEMIKFSVNTHRGCFGGCSFCTISAHQGKFVSSRSRSSILREVALIAAMPSFKGVLSDAGGPSANMYGMAGRDVQKCRKCLRPSCLFPRLCSNMNNDHRPLIEIYNDITAVKGVRKLFVGSGIRYDLFSGRDGTQYLEKVVRDHTSGRLKVAPEHTEEHVLRLMRKPSFDLYVDLKKQFHDICRRNGLKYQLVPYFISSHPGCTMQDMKNLARTIHQHDIRPEPVQDFTPTPMTLSSVMYYTGLDPYTGKSLPVARTTSEKRSQKDYFFKS